MAKEGPQKKKAIAAFLKHGYNQIQIKKKKGHSPILNAARVCPL